MINFKKMQFEEAKKAIKEGKELYLIAFSVLINHVPRIGSLVYTTEKGLSLYEVYFELQNNKVLAHFHDENGILAITNIQKL